MRIFVSFMGFQRTVTGTDRIDLILEEGALVAEVLAQVKASYPNLPYSGKSALVTLNGQVTPLDYVLRSEDDISFLPFIGGG